MTTPLRVLLVEDDEGDAELVMRELTRGGYDLDWRRVETREELVQALVGRDWDLVICDHRLPAFGSQAALDVKRERGLDIPFIIVSGAAPEDVVTDAMRAGAQDFISKNGLVRLVPAVRRELQEAALRQERRFIEEELAESQGRYAMMFHENPAPMLLVDPATLRVVEANQAAAAFFGQPPDTLEHTQITALSVLAREGEWRGVQRYRRQRAYIFQDRVLCADGAMREVDVYAVKISQGRRSLLLATLFDQTDRRAAEARASLLAEAVAQVSDAIALMDAAGTIEYVNQAFERMVGLDLPMIAGWTLGDLLDEAPLAEAARRAAAGEAWDGRTTLRLEGGRLREVAVRYSPVRDAAGQVAHLVAMLRDITGETERERQYRQVDKMEALGTLAAGVAHDFNNLLTTISSAAELLKAALPADSPAQSRVAAIQQAGLCATGLTRQILSFSRKGTDQRVPMDLSILVRNSLQMMRSSRPAGVTITSELTSGIWVEGDPAQLQQVVLNLALNAIQSMRIKGGTLHVGLSETQAEGPDSGSRYALLTVEDTGCGMDAPTLERIFDPFFTTKPAGEGTGLGLSIVHAAVTGAGGRIQVQSRPGEGTLFRVLWPCAAAATQPPESPVPAAISGQESILLVEDEELVAALARLGLENLGYAVSTRRDAGEALGLLSEAPERWDLVATALALPDMTGAEFATALRQIRADLPVLLLSGLPMPATLALAEAGAFAEVVAKPYTPHGLAAAVRRVLDGRPKPAVRPVPPRVRPNPAPAPREARRPAILLAEDSQTTRSMIQSWLERAGYEVVAVEDGVAALGRFKDNPDPERFGVLLTDVVMPRMDGLSLARLIRAMDPALPIAIFTSNEDRETVASALNLGVDEFLNKPFDAPALLGCVERLLARHRDRLAERRSAETAHEVRQAQQRMVAVPEKGLPIYSVCEPLTDAGGDVFRCMTCADGSILFVLADVAGHSVQSSYAVASFLTMLSAFVGECVTLMALPPGQAFPATERARSLHSCGLYGSIACRPLQHLADKFNQGIQSGPFSEIPVCALFGLWNPSNGRLEVLNAGIPHGILSRRDGSAEPLALNGTPLGIFPEPFLESTELRLQPGDRLIFGTDGFFDVLSPERQPFADRVPELWGSLRDTPMDWALSAVCGKVREHALSRPTDDLLVIGFEQPTLTRDPEELIMHLPSTPRAVDVACDRLGECLKASALGARLDESAFFDITLAVREALSNAVIHGNGERPGATVVLRCHPDVAAGRLTVSVKDEGPGFDLETHAPPEDPLSERGRGISMIRAFADEVRMEGSELTLTFLAEEKHP